jgi:uncharacterized membrane protein YphA (DoxX/SURF4 family)
MATATKTEKIIYWVSTSLLALFILPGIFFINSKIATDSMAHLSLPHWFAMEAGIGSFIGGLILIIPMWKRLKEWGYVALGIVYLSALIAHLFVDGVILGSFAPLINFAILLVSYIYYHKVYDTKS